MCLTVVGALWIASVLQLIPGGGAMLVMSVVIAILVLRPRVDLPTTTTLALAGVLLAGCLVSLPLALGGFEAAATARHTGCLTCEHGRYFALGTALPTLLVTGAYVHRYVVREAILCRLGRVALYVAIGWWAVCSALALSFRFS